MAPEIQTIVSERVDRAIEDQWCSAASAVVVHEGRTIARYGAGTLASHEGVADDPGVAGARVTHPEPADTNTWFDLASVTKVVSAVTLLKLVEHGDLALDDAVAAHLPSFADGERAQVTLRHLLSHTSGLPATWSGWFLPLDRARELGLDEPLGEWPASAGSRGDLLADLLSLPLQDSPGTAWTYSCVGYNTAMALAEAATGRAWADLVTSLVLQPMDLAEGIAFAPAGAVAATEYQPELGRGVVSGIVHDETSWSLGGRCANAGLFATVDALAQFTEAIRTDTLPCSHDLLVANALPTTLGRELAGSETPWGHSLGLRIGQDWLAAPRALGHAGFTGTGIMINPALDLSVVVLANRVHPRRSDRQVHRLRQEICAAATQALTDAD
ncbi:serine hydrolase domain-containing protein [Propionibacteriaceae bacterium Y1923]|uniref:serine hydrolase domain-containing protein n=1 Tax=Aestuariimicrobium sp. Y1814 TaxID=3418742 RepID=UPI003C291F00